MPEAKKSQMRCNHDGKNVVLQVRTVDDGAVFFAVMDRASYRHLLRELLSSGMAVFPDVADLLRNESPPSVGGGMGIAQISPRAKEIARKMALVPPKKKK